MTLYYLAQVYGHIAGHSDDAAHYIQLTLQRQLNGNYDKLEWCTNAIGLAAFYKKNENWSLACHCLSASEALLDTYQVIDVDEGEVNDNVSLIRAKLKVAWGDFYRDVLKNVRMNILGMTSTILQSSKTRYNGDVACFSLLRFKD